MKELKIAIIECDNHYGVHSKSNESIMYQFLKDHKKQVTQVFNLGDEIDNPFMSDFSVNPSYNYTAQEEWDLFSQHVKKMVDLTHKNLKYTLIAGNHSLTRLDEKKNMNRGIASLRNLQYKNILKESLNDQGVDLKNVKISLKPLTYKFNKKNKAVFTHGDPRLDRYIKGGSTGVRRTAEQYPFKGDIYMGHKHVFIDYPRLYEGTYVHSIGMMADKEQMAKNYLSYYTYECGFGIILYNDESYFYQPVKIVNGEALILGKTYKSTTKQF